jgi:hypothetical protein
MRKYAITPAIEALINKAVAIEAEDVLEADALGFMARAMVQATLPHKNVAGNEFVRHNGNFTLHMLAPSEIGLPYGAIPRLLLAWMSTEAVRTNSRELELGDSMAAFMRELGLSSQGSNIASLKNQARRLFNTTVTATYADHGQTDDRGFRLADRSTLWWHARDPSQASLWRSTVILSEPFYREVVEFPVPIDMRALRALKRSPLALDIYCWLTYRASYATRPSLIIWPMLAMQFGSHYAVLRQFKAAFLAELRKVAVVYRGAEFEVTEPGLLIKPSPTHVPRLT